jgi:gentisate 1,2-dioxygenase
MLPGDLVLTPPWAWHDHGNDTKNPMIWLDGLDLPLVNFLEMSFHDPYSEDTQPITESPGSSLAKYGSMALQPTWIERKEEGSSPLMYYPWDRTREALERLATGEDGSPYDGVMMEYTNPSTGGHAMPTIACFVQLLRPGESTKSHRHTTSSVYHVVVGKGHTLVGDQKLDWANKDTFCVPGWAFHEHVNESPTEPAFLFSFTDTPVLKALGFYREEPKP